MHVALLKHTREPKMAPSRASATPASTPVIAPETETDPDPIIASYSVFIKPPLPQSRKLLILQQPNKAAASVPYGDSALPLTELRLKPQSGIVEADIRIDTTEQYDRTKGMAWGAALQKSTAARSGGSHGLPGGFGSIRPVRGRGAAGGAGQEGDDGVEEVLSWGDAVRQDRVLRTRTLGGQAPELTDCTVMVGVFQGGESPA
jgi:DNA-directed RNA polymerase III subunit RPC5